MAERADSVRRGRGRWCGFALAGSALLVLPGCLVDKGRCGPNQESNPADNCICKLGFVPDKNLVCQPCGLNEVSIADKCTCAAGFARDAAQQCVAVTADVGKPCQTDADCPTAGPHCHRPARGEPYCTITGCTQLMECPGDYGCDLNVSPSVCARAPTGQFEPCKTQQDCAGNEASFCESTVSGLCVVSGCKTDNDCFAGLECCDLSSFGLPTLCVAEGVCPIK